METKSLLTGLLAIAFAWPLQSQVTFRLDSMPDYTPAEDLISICGDFNGWTLGDPAYVLQKNPSGKWYITLPAQPAGTGIAYLFARNSIWKFEREASGLPKAERHYTFSTTPDTVGIVIHNWQDHGGWTGTTAAPNVTRISESFSMPQLGRTRRVWLYLPPDYAGSGKSYPVIYMQDGENVFDAYTSGRGEWGVDESLNELAAEGKEVPIVVAVDGGWRRNYEYSPWYFEYYGIHGQGNLYVDFLTNTLKPYVDSAYRTRPGRESTCILGSSIGGLISFYAAFRRPDVFGKAGVFSPSYWISDSVWKFIRTVDKVHPMRVYQIVGTEEGTDMTDPVAGMQEMLMGAGFSEEECTYKVVEGAAHNELFWGSEFKEAYLWLFPEAISSMGNEELRSGLAVYPSPAGNTLYIHPGLNDPDKTVTLYNLAGVAVYRVIQPSGNQIQIANLPKGIYLFRITGRDGVYTGKFVKE